MYIIFNKISFKTSLERKPSNLSYIFILSVNFENITVELHVFIISFMLAKYQEHHTRKISRRSKINCYVIK